MSRLWSCGFELQSVLTNIEWDLTNGSPTISTATFRSGAAALRVSGVSQYITHKYTPSGTTTNRFVRFYFRIATAAGTNASAIALLRDTTSGNGPSIRINTNNTLELWDEQGAIQRGSDSSALSTNTWYRIEFSYNYSTGAIAAYIDGTQFASGTTTASMSMDTFRLGMIDAATCDFYYDDVAINDSSGTFQTGLPSAGSILHLRPNAAGDSNQMAGAVSTNYQFVDEITPDGATTVLNFNSDAVNDVDDYNIDNTPAAINSSDIISLVSVGYHMAGVSSTSDTFAIRFKATSGGTVQESATLVGINDLVYRTNNEAGTPAVYKLTLYDMPGASTTGITKANLDTSQIGFRKVAQNAGGGRMSTMWLLVEYTPLPPPPVPTTGGTALMMGI